MKPMLLYICAAIVCICSVSCKKDRLSNFRDPTSITNPYFPVAVDKKYIYEGQTPDGLEHVEERRLKSTKIITGIKCIEVEFKAFIDGQLIEKAIDWYAQDNKGNVWYFGEAVDNYENGQLKDHDGSWEAGVDGAVAGTIMLAHPTVGTRYREEFLEGEAEDEAEITGVGLTVTIPLNTYNNCIKTRNFTRLEPTLNENKYYAPGIGLVKEENVADKSQIVLIAIE